MDADDTRPTWGQAGGELGVKLVVRYDAHPRNEEVLVEGRACISAMVAFI